MNCEILSIESTNGNYCVSKHDVISLCIIEFLQSSIRLQSIVLLFLLSASITDSDSCVGGRRSAYCTAVEEEEAEAVAVVQSYFRSIRESNMDQCKGVDGLGSLLHVHLPVIFLKSSCPNFCDTLGLLGKTEDSVFCRGFMEGVVVTDGLASEYLHLVLEGGDDWRTPLQKVFNEKLGINWCFLVMELQSGAAHFHIVAISSTTIPTAVGVPNDDTKSENIPVNNKKTVVSKGRNSLMNGMDGENYINGDGSADSGISLLDSDTEKSSKCMKSHELSEHEPIPSTVKQIEIVNGSEFVIPRAIPITTSKTNLETTNKDNISTVPESFTMRRNSIKYEIHKKVERILEEEEKEKSEDWDKSASELISNQNMANHCLNGRDISGEIRMKRSMPVHISSIFPKNFLSNGPNSLQRLSSRDDILLTRRLVDEEMPPVQLGELRQVHPHWDELCGQALNSGYHELIKKADKLLTDCQRHVHSEPDLHDVLSVLTNVQVHILNPVDILRPAMDEGVCCFPYGELLDQTFYIIEKAKEIMEGRKDIIIKWKPVAELARRAQLHYKSNLKALMEEKLGETTLCSEKAIVKDSSLLVIHISVDGTTSY
ncbi:hypothetical protein DINM_003390 [Dirofilaria immitis]|nr:hypothetical protein [Dirofilaria immitis]